MADEMLMKPGLGRPIPARCYDIYECQDTSPQTWEVEELKKKKKNPEIGA